MKQVSTADDSFPSPTPNAERRRGRRPKGKPAPQSSTQSPAEEASSNSLIFQPILIYTSLLTFHYSLKHFRQPPTPFMKVSCGRFFSYTILLLRGLAAPISKKRPPPKGRPLGLIYFLSTNPFAASTSSYRFNTFFPFWM